MGSQLLITLKPRTWWYSFHTEYATPRIIRWGTGVAPRSQLGS